MKREELLNAYHQRVFFNKIQPAIIGEVGFEISADVVLELSQNNNKLLFENARLNEEIEKLKERMNRNMKIADQTVFGMRDTAFDLIGMTADVLLHNRELREKVEKLEADKERMFNDLVKYEKQIQDLNEQLKEKSIIWETDGI